MGWMEVEWGWDEGEAKISSTLGSNVGEEILTMDKTNFICWLWGTCSYARISLGMVSLIIVLVTQSEKWDVVEWKLWEWAGITKGIWDKDVSHLEVDEERKSSVDECRHLYPLWFELYPRKTYLDVWTSNLCL